MNQSKLNQSTKSLLLCSIGFLMSSGIAMAQVDNTSEIFKTLKAKDSILFKIGFNKCEVERSAELMTEDLEFYHDKGGVTTSKEAFVTQMKTGLCKKDNPEKIYRFLVEGSLDVFPLYNNGELYGALQNGKHFFSPMKSMTYEETDNYALFSHLWIIENSQWKLKRVISYNHVSKEKNLKTIEVSKEILEPYTGNYSTKTGNATISIKNNNLLLKAGEMVIELEAISEILFAHPKAPLTFEFVKNNEDLTHKILVRENGKLVEEVKKNNQ